MILLDMRPPAGAGKGGGRKARRPGSAPSETIPRSMRETHCPFCLEELSSRYFEKSSILQSRCERCGYVKQSGPRG